MMSNAHTKEVREYLISSGLSDSHLIDDLVDHIVCEIELLMDSGNMDFSRALEIAKEKILPDNPFEVQQDLMILTTKTPNIMFKKIAYTGAYLSALCFIIAIALFTISSLSDRKLELAQYQQQYEFEQASKVNDTASIKKWGSYLVEQKSKSYDQLMQSQTFFLISLLIFSITYLPYQFYTRSQRVPEQPQYA